MSSVSSSSSSSSSSGNKPMITLEPLLSFSNTTTTTLSSSHHYNGLQRNVQQQQHQQQQQQKEEEKEDEDENEQYSNSILPIPDELFNYSTLRTNRCILVNNVNNDDNTKLRGHQRVFDHVMQQVHEDLFFSKQESHNNKLNTSSISQSQETKIPTVTTTTTSSSTPLSTMFNGLYGPFSNRIDFINEIQSQLPQTDSSFSSSSSQQQQQQQQFQSDHHQHQQQSLLLSSSSSSSLTLPATLSTLSSIPFTNSQQPSGVIQGMAPMSIQQQQQQQQQQSNVYSQMNSYSLGICQSTDSLNNTNYYYNDGNSDVTGNISSSNINSGNKPGPFEIKYRVSRKVKAMEDSSRSLSLFLKKAEKMVVGGNKCIHDCEKLKKSCAVENFVSNDKSLFGDNYKVCVISPKMRSKYPKYSLNFTKRNASEICQQQSSSLSMLSPSTPNNNKDNKENDKMLVVSGHQKCALFKLNVCESFITNSLFSLLKSEVDDFRKLDWDHSCVTKGLFQADFKNLIPSHSIYSSSSSSSSSSSMQSSYDDKLNEIHLSSMTNPSQSIVISEHSSNFIDDGFYTSSERSNWIKVYAESLHNRYRSSKGLFHTKLLPLNVTLSMIMGHRDAIKKVTIAVEKVIASFPGTSVHFGRTFKDYIYTDILTEFIIYAPARIIRCYVKNSVGVIVSGEEYGFSFFPRVIKEILNS